MTTVTNEMKHKAIGVADAIAKLRPGCIFSLYNNTFVSWWDPDNKPAPKWDEVLDQIAKDEVEWAKTQYSRDRVEQYPDAKEQVDTLWHAIESGGTIDQDSDWFKQIKAIKDKYPKP